jgi:hypothetical protein
MAEIKDSPIQWTIPLLIAICLISISAQAKYGGGNGIPEDPYQIWTAEQMNEIGLNEDDWNKHFKLMADINLFAYSGTLFNIIGTPDREFAGVFDGNSHRICNFTYHCNAVFNVGLFGYVYGRNAEIKDLGLIRPNIDAGTGDCVGSLVGYLSYGKITNCYAKSGSIAGNDYVGGLVGSAQVEATIDCCYVEGATVSGNLVVGGLVGETYGATVLNCYSTCNVTGEEGVGGLVGFKSGVITNCYSVGRVTGTTWVGGLVGGNLGAVRASFWDIQTSGQTESAGGTGLTTAEMQKAGTFRDACWYTCAGLWIWTIDEGRDYPRLWWENKPGEMVQPIRLSDFLSGAGTQDDPYLIYTAQDLNLIGLAVCDWDKHFKVMADIDLSGLDGKDGRPAFNIIAPDSSDATLWFESTFFTGSFDGNGHTISHLTITGGSYLGLFGQLKPGAEVKNLGVVDVNITGSWRIGGLVGANGGAVTQCYQAVSQ